MLVNRTGWDLVLLSERCDAVIPPRRRTPHRGGITNQLEKVLAVPHFVGKWCALSQGINAVPDGLECIAEWLLLDCEPLCADQAELGTPVAQSLHQLDPIDVAFHWSGRPVEGIRMAARSAPTACVPMPALSTNCTFQAQSLKIARHEI